MARFGTGTAAGISAVVALSLLVGAFFAGNWQDSRKSAASEKETAGEAAPNLAKDDRLLIGMTREQFSEVLGYPGEEHSIVRDFGQPHREDPTDPSTWEVLVYWRYDYGVKEGYRPRTDPFGKPEADFVGFDRQGLENGDVRTQIVVLWRGDRVNRIRYKTALEDGSIAGYEIASGLKEPPPPAESPSAEAPLLAEFGSAYA